MYFTSLLGASSGGSATNVSMWSADRPPVREWLTNQPRAEEQASRKIPGEERMVRNQMLTIRSDAGSTENGPAFRNARSGRAPLLDRSRTGLFTTGSGTKTRGCKLLIWRALQDSNLRPPGS